MIDHNLICNNEVKECMNPLNLTTQWPNFSKRGGVFQKALYASNFWQAILISVENRGVVLVGKTENQPLKLLY